jgi:uncharacterized membrane-anchored protein YitT (DUF2179 family)
LKKFAKKAFLAQANRAKSGHRFPPAEKSCDMNAHGLLREVKDDFYDLTHSVCSWKFWQTVAVMCFGLSLMGVAINGILLPHKMVSSGATGIAMTVYYFLGKPSVGVIYWLLNVPILIVGYRAMSLRFVVLAIIGVFISGATLQFTHAVRLPMADPMMASITAGFLTGTGVGLYLRFGGSAGGLDIVAAVLRRKLGFPMGSTFLAVNVLNIVAGYVLTGSQEIAFYTAVAMFVHSRMVERMQSGFSGRKAAFIVSSQPDLLARQILKMLNRGCTFFHASGGMSQKQTRVIYTVVNMIELARLKEMIYNLDPQAFISISDATEVIGNRFIKWEDEGFEKSRRALQEKGQTISLVAAAVGSQATDAAPTDAAADSDANGRRSKNADVSDA